MGIKLRRVIVAAAAGILWWNLVVILFGRLLPEGWGFRTWWGPYVLGAIFLTSVVLCYWAFTVHERVIAERRARDELLSSEPDRTASG